MIFSLLLYAIMLAVVVISVGGQNVHQLLKRLGFDHIELSKDVTYAIAFTGALLVASIAIQFAFYSIGMAEDVQRVADQIAQFDLNEIIVLVTVASIVEEIFFRGFIQRHTNILVAAFLFSYFHIIYGSLAELIGTFVLGVLLGIEYAKRSNVFAPILSHLFYNLMTVTVVYGI